MTFSSINRSFLGVYSNFCPSLLKFAAYLVGAGGIGQVHACDEPAIRHFVGSPQLVVKVITVRSEVECQGTATGDLVH